MGEPSIGDRLFGLGWRAGAVLPIELHPAICRHLHHTDGEPPQQIDPSDWVIVVSQSCDVVVPNDSAEPYVELLWARNHEGKPRTQFCDLRSTRRLDFRPNRNAFPDKVLTAHASADRYFVPRSALLEGRPDPDRVLSTAAIKRLHAWLALRCNRPSWPNAFVDRIRPAKEQLLNALGPLTDDVAEVRVGIRPYDRELGPDDKYDVSVYFVVPVERFESSPEIRRLVAESFNAFVNALRDCSGLELNDLSDFVSGDEFRWEQVQRTDLWDFAYLSPLE